MSSVSLSLVAVDVGGVTVGVTGAAEGVSGVLGACTAAALAALQKAVDPPFLPPHVQLYESLDVDTKPVLPLLQRFIDGALANEPPCDEPHVPLVAATAGVDGAGTVAGI